MMKRNKAYIISRAACLSHTKIDDVRRILDSLLGSMAEVLCDGDEVTLGRMGKLMAEVGDKPDVKISFVASKSFQKEIDAKFVENRDTKI